VLLWRKEFDANNLVTPNKLPVSEELLKKGGIFMRNEDINCIPMCHFVVKTHKKDQFPHAEICRQITFFFERVYKFNVDDPIVLLFDMADAGYSNLDMEMIKFVVNCLKTYYPGLIDYMIIYQMPFIFNAAWKIIKNWLPPESVKLIKFVDKKSIKEYVQESQLFVHMGGTDKFKYTYDFKALFPPKPEISTQSKIIITSNNNKNKMSIASTQDCIVITKLQTTPKHQEQTQQQQSDEQANTMSSAQNQQRPLEEAAVDSIQRTDSFVSMSPKLFDDVLENDTTNTKKAKSTNPPKNLLNGSLNKTISFESNMIMTNGDALVFHALKTPLLTIDPGDELMFNVTDGKADITQYIKLTNTAGLTLAYKIKITSPDKFRVKPGTGIIEKAGTVQIMINYLKEYHNSATSHRDKFLILWTPINSKIQQSELSEFWKQVILKKENLNDHKVKCLVIRPNESIAINKKSIKQTDPSMVASINSFNSITSTTNNTTSNETFTTTTSTTNTNAVRSLKKQANKLGVEEALLKNELIDSNHLQHLTNNQTSNLNSSSQDQNINPAVMTKLYNIDNNVKQTIANQQKLIKQYSIILYSIYFLIIVNVVQLIFRVKNFP
jgi:hypothetical protein